jgi:hypothetical protein
MLLALVIPAHGHGVLSSRAIERFCRRDAGERSILCAPVPDHTVSARFCRRHIDMPVAVFATVLRRWRDAGLIRRGLAVLDGTRVTASAARDANRGGATLEEQVRRMLAEAQSTGQGEGRPSGPESREAAPPALSRREGCLAQIAAAAADAGFWPEENAANRTEECALFIATRQDRTQRAELRAAASPRGRMLKGLSVHQRLQRTLRTKRGRTIYAKRGASVEPVIGQMKHRRGAGQVSMRGLGACRGAWHGGMPPCTRCATCTGGLSGAGQRVVGGAKSWRTGPEMRQ